MFDFLNPVFLYALPIVLIPVIIHLFGIKRPISQVFAPYPILLLIKSRIIKRKRLHSFILILLRILLILLILLSFAGVYLRVGTTESRSRGKCLLIVDNSPSVKVMSGGRLLGEYLIEEIERYVKENSSTCEGFVIHRLSEQDRFDIPSEEIKSDTLIKRLFSSSGRYIQLYEELPLALKQGVGEEGFYRIVLFSDLYSHSVQNISALSELIRAYNVEVRHIRLNPVSNAYIEQRGFERTGDNEYTLIVDVINGGESPFYGSTSLFEGDEKIGSESVNIPPHSKKEVRFMPDGNGNSDRERFFRVVVEGDDFDYDNTEYLYYKSQKGRKVLLVNGEPASIETKSETFFLSSAIRSYFGDSVQVYTVLEDMIPETPELYDVIVLSNVNRLSYNLGLLSKYIRSGGRVLITLGGRVDTQDYNGVDFIPCNISLASEMKPEEGFEISDSSFRGEVLDTSNLFKKVRIQRMFDVICPQDSKVILKTRGDRPLLISKRYGDGLVYLYTTSIDMDMNDLPIRKDYLPFVATLFKNMFSGLITKRVVYSRPYEDISINGVNCKDAKMLNIRGEVVENRLICNLMPDGSGTLNIRSPETFGFYTVNMPDTELLIVVNGDKRESELIRLPSEQIESIYNKKGYAGSGGITPFGLGNRNVNLIEFLLLFAAVVLAFEMFVMNRR